MVELHFTNPETYTQDLKSILTMDEKELDQWETSIGFKSYRSWFNQSADEFFEIKSETEYQKWLEEYSDILYVQDSIVNPILSGRIYDRVVNRSGVFVVGNSIHKVLPDKMIIIPSGDRSLLPRAMELKNSNEEIGIKVFPFLNQEKKTIELRNSQTCEKYEVSSSHEEGGDRRVYLTIDLGYLTTYIPQGGYLIETFLRLNAYGLKKGLFGGFNSYKTDIYIENVSVQAKDNFGNSILGIDNFGHTEEDSREFGQTFLLGDKIGELFYDFSVPEILWGVGRAKTRGTGSEWTRFCCNEPTGITCPSLTD